MFYANTLKLFSPKCTYMYMYVCTYTSYTLKKLGLNLSLSKEFVTHDINRFCLLLCLNRPFSAIFWSWQSSQLYFNQLRWEPSQSINYYRNYIGICAKHYKKFQTILNRKTNFSDELTPNKIKSRVTHKIQLQIFSNK